MTVVTNCRLSKEREKYRKKKKKERDREKYFPSSLEISMDVVLLFVLGNTMMTHNDDNF
jgi:hypothetical protein